MYTRLGSVLSLMCALGCATVSGTAHAKGDKVEYAPEIYEQVIDIYTSSKISAQAQGFFGNADAIGAIENDFTKFMALTPGAKVTALGSMGQCLISSGFMLDSEFNLLLGTFDAFASTDAERAQKMMNSLLDSINGAGASSPFAVAFTTGLEAAAETDDDGGSVVDDAVEIAQDAVEAAATGAGAAIGNTIAGKEGAAVGAFIGKTSSKVTVGAHKKIYDWMWGGGDGVVANPNGDPCTPPLFTFGRPKL